MSITIVVIITLMGGSLHCRLLHRWKKSVDYIRHYSKKLLILNSQVASHINIFMSQSCAQEFKWNDAEVSPISTYWFLSIYYIDDWCLSAQWSMRQSAKTGRRTSGESSSFLSQKFPTFSTENFPLSRRQRLVVSC